MMLYLAYLFCFIGLFVLWFIPRYRWYKRIKKYFELLPGSHIKNLFGDMCLILLQKNQKIHVVVTNISHACARMFKKEGMFAGWLLFRPTLIVYKAEHVEVILSSNTNIDKAQEYVLLEPWLGNGLVTSNGHLWRRHRKALTPSFHFRILEEFIPIVNEQGKFLIRKLGEKLNEPWIDLLPFVTRCTLDIICETSMGIQLGSQDEKEAKYVNALHSLLETVLWRIAIPWLQPPLIFYAFPMGRRFLKNLKIVREFTKQVVSRRKADFSKKQQMDNGLPKDSATNPRLALLDMLLYYHVHDKEFTEEDIRDEVNTFMFAGHDTTALGITWTLYLLGLYPNIQDKVHEELDSVFGSDKERFITIDDLKNLKYLDCVIKESLRLYPPVPVIGRQITEDALFNDGKDVIPAGTSCAIVISVLHRDENCFPNPHRFIPERFLPENCKGRNPFAFIPFSAGPRNCIGQRFAMNEEKIILSSVLRNFKIKSLDAEDKQDLDGNVTLKPRGPIRVKFTPKEETGF